MAPPWIAEKASARRQNSAKPGAWRAESALSAGQAVARVRCFGVVGPKRRTVRCDSSHHSFLSWERNRGFLYRAGCLPTSSQKTHFDGFRYSSGQPVEDDDRLCEGFDDGAKSRLAA
jgi:hypothetical protein